MRANLRRTGLVVLAAAAALSSWTGPGALAAKLSPSFAFGTRLDQNRSPGVMARRDTIMGTFQPALGVESGTSTSGLRVSVGTLYGYRFLPSAPGAAVRTQVFDRISDRASLQAARTWSQTDALTLGGDYLRSHDPIELGAWSALDIGDTKEWNAWGRGSLWRFEGAYRIDDWAYEQVGERDARAVSWSATALPVRHRADAWLVGWRQRQLGLGGATSVRSQAAVVGYRRMLAPALRMDVEVGGVDIRYGDGTHQNGPAGGITLTGDEVERTILVPRVQVWQDVATNVMAEVVHRLPDGRVSLRWVSLADVEGGIYRDPTYVREVALGAQDTLARVTVLGLEASYGQTRPFRTVGPKTELVRATGWLERRMRPWLTGRGSCSYLRQAGVGAVGSGGPILHRVRWDVALAAHAP